MFFLSLTLGAAVAQEVQVKEKVLEADGSFLPGASVSIKGRNKGTISDASGNFSILAGKGSTLVLSMVGYESLEYEVKGAVSNLELTLAANMLNVISKRAAFKSTNSPAQNTAAAEAMTITAQQVTLDFILDERTREFYGEGLRWWDLVRTKSLISRIKKYNPEDAAKIQDFHALRPIPQRQIEAVTEGPKFAQNPGY